MQTATGARCLAGLVGSMERLTVLPVGKWSERDAIWTAVVEVLGWIYRCEEAEQKADAGYYDHRNACEPGRTVAGLVWIRGLVEHHQAEVQEALWVPTTLYIEDRHGQLHPALRIDAWNDKTKEWVPTKGTQRFHIQWPVRDNLPEGKPEKRERTLMYDKQVATRELLPPLHQALSYFSEER